MSLVPAYASSSDEDDSSHSSENEQTTTEPQQPKPEPILLPSASFMLSGISKIATAGHVFNNPYKEAENAKIASLEKHVKMVRINTR